MSYGRPHGSGAAWTDERIALLKKLWPTGASASQICAQLGGGLSRNAVIGKVHRLGLPGRQSSSCTPRAPRKRKPSAPALLPSTISSRSIERALIDIEPAIESDPREAIDLPPEPESGERVTLHDLRERMCRWPSGDSRKGESVTFCGSGGCSGAYCARHSLLAYQPARRPRRAVHKPAKLSGFALRVGFYS